MTVTTTVTQTRTETLERTKTVTMAAPVAVYVPQSGGTLELKPPAFYTGVSGGVILVDRWISYGEQEARAKVRFEFNDCQPDCASGKRTLAPATVRLSNVGPCKGAPAFRDLTVIASDSPDVNVGDSVDIGAFCHEGD